MSQPVTPGVRAKHYVGRALNIRSEEWPRLLYLYGMALVALTGIGWGETIVVASYLQRVGVEFLPWAFVFSALASIVSLFIYSGFADRVSNDRLFIWILGLSAAGVLAGLILLATNAAVTAYLLLYLILSVPLTDLYNVHWATYVSNYYDTRAAKRVIPVLSTSTRVAGILAGVTMPLITGRVPPQAIVAIWLVALIGMAVMIFLMPRVLKDKVALRATTLVSGARPRSAYLDNLREGYAFVAESKFLRSLALATLLTTMWLAIINYRSSAILLGNLQTTVAIANFTGVLSAAANLVALPVQLFLLSRLINRVGLGDSSLVYPTGGLAVGAGLLAVPGLFMAALGYVTRTVFRTTFRSPVDALLYNAVPLRVKGRARAFIGGLLVPLGTLLGGLLLLSPVVKSNLWLGILIGLSALAVLISALVVRRQYGRALILMLAQEDYLGVLSQGDLFQGVELTADAATISKLREKLLGSTSPEFTIFMARLISEASGNEGVPILAEVARTTTDARVRAALIDVVAAAGEQGQAARQMYVGYLSDTDAGVRLSALAGLGQDAAGASTRGLVQPMLADPDTEVRARAIAAFLDSAEPEVRQVAAPALEGLLTSERAGARALGVRLLGGSRRDERAAGKRLLAYLADRADEVRTEAALAIEAMAPVSFGEELHPELHAAMRSLLTDPVQRVRHAALTVLSGLDTREASAAMLEALADDSPDVRLQASDALVAAGKPVISLVHPRLNSPDARMRKMAAVILGRVDPRQFGALVESHITSDLLSIYRNQGLAGALEPVEHVVSLAVLPCALREQSLELRDGLFHLLSAVHPPAAMAVIEGSLRSENERTRANAVEALESLTTPRLAGLIAPLFEPDAWNGRLTVGAQDSWGVVRTALDTPEKALREVLAQHEDAWMRAIAAYSLGDWGAQLPATVPSSVPAGSVPADVEALLQLAGSDAATEVRLAGAAARRKWTGSRTDSGEGVMLSVIEKIILMKEVPFFQGMTVDQLKVLAAVCEEQFFPQGGFIVSRGDAGGTLYVIVSGRVAIEQERRTGSSARLATLGAHAYFGEMNLFDGTPHSAAAQVLQDTQVLRLRREPLIALARQHPELALALINVLTQRLRDANERVADLTRSKPKELHKLYDSLA